MTALVLIGLVSSIVGEITGTVFLRTVSIGRKVWWIGVGGGYVFAFALIVGGVLLIELGSAH